MKSRSEHTPGPWEIDTQTSGIYIRKSGRYIAAFPWSTLIGSESEAQMKSDMRLIAAAPELLAALGALVDAAQDSVYNTAPTALMLRAYEKANIVARAAIAKAEGR